jgi:hypothetical protein
MQHLPVTRIVVAYVLLSGVLILLQYVGLIANGFVLIVYLPLYLVLTLSLPNETLRVLLTFIGPPTPAGWAIGSVLLLLPMASLEYALRRPPGRRFLPVIIVASGLWAYVIAILWPHLLERFYNMAFLKSFANGADEATALDQLQRQAGEAYTWTPLKALILLAPPGIALLVAMVQRRRQSRSSPPPDS